MFSEKSSKKLTAIVVDDELHGRENLKKLIETYCHEIEILGLADSVVSAKELVSVFNPDVVFLDINMPVLDGFDFLEEYVERNFMVVFVTAHDDYGINAVKAGAVDYILKPVNIKELKQTIKKLLLFHSREKKVELQNVNEKLVIPASQGFNILVVDEIVRLEAEGCYTKVYLVDGKSSLVTRTLKDFEDSLPKVKFLRVHKSNIINLKYIKSYSKISGNYVTMIDGSRIEISRRKAPEFIQKIKTALKSV